MSQRSILCKYLSIGLGAFLTAGCRPQLEPDEGAILHCFRNARVHGDVRRVWPEGQQYVDAVLKADAKLQKELNPLRKLQFPQSLWSREDPRWRNKKDVADVAAALSELLNQKGADREELLGVLTQAVEEVPAALVSPAAHEAGLVQNVWHSLALEGTERGVDLREAMKELEEAVRARLALFEAVAKIGSDFDSEATGLSVENPTRQARIDQSYGELATRLDQHCEAFLVYAEAELIASAAKGKIKERNEREYQTNLRAYLRKGLAAVPKGLQNLKQRTEEEAREEASPATKAFLEGRIEQLENERKKMKTRVDEILDRAKTAGERATDN